MKVYGQLEYAQLHNLASDPTPTSDGFIYFNTVSLFGKIYNGTVWKTLVETDSSQVLTNKDYDGGTAANTRRITVPKDTLANLLSLTRKQGTILYGSDTDVLYKDDGATLTAVGAGVASISANVRATEGAGTTTLTVADKTYQIFDLSAGRDVVLPTTGVAKGDVWQMGLQTIGQALSVKASDSSLIATVLEGSATFIPLISTPVTNTDWKVIGVAQITSWVPYTLVIGGVTTAPTPGTTTIDTAYWRRVGDSMEINYTFRQTSAGSIGSGVYLFPIPAGYTIDGSKIEIATTASSGGIGACGSVAMERLTTLAVGTAIAYTTTDLALQVEVSGGTTDLVSSSFYALDVAEKISFTARIPIVEFA